MIQATAGDPMTNRNCMRYERRNNTSVQSDRLALRAFRPEDLEPLLGLAHDPQVALYLNEGEPPTALSPS